MKHIFSAFHNNIKRWNCIISYVTCRSRQTKTNEDDDNENDDADGDDDNIDDSSVARHKLMRKNTFRDFVTHFIYIYIKYTFVCERARARVGSKHCFSVIILHITVPLNGDDIWMMFGAKLNEQFTYANEWCGERTSKAAPFRTYASSF